jgi:hypothetical protein
MRPFDVTEQAPEPNDFSHKKAPSGWLETPSLLVAAEDHISPSELVLRGNNFVAGLSNQTRLNYSRFPRRRAKMVETPHVGCYVPKRFFCARRDENGNPDGNRCYRSWLTFQCAPRVSQPLNTSARMQPPRA